MRRWPPTRARRSSPPAAVETVVSERMRPPGITVNGKNDRHEVAECNGNSAPPPNRVRRAAGSERHGCDRRCRAVRRVRPLCAGRQHPSTIRRATFPLRAGQRPLAGAVGCQYRDCCVGGADRGGGVQDDRVAPLVAHLAPRVRGSVESFQRETQDEPVPFRRPISARMSSVSTNSRTRRPPSSELSRMWNGGRKSHTAAAAITTSARSNRASVASYICRVVSHGPLRNRRGPGLPPDRRQGPRRDRLQNRLGQRHPHPATAGIRENRTPSRFSRVGPTVMRKRSIGDVVGSEPGSKPFSKPGCWHENSKVATRTCPAEGFETTSRDVA